MKKIIFLMMLILALSPIFAGNYFTPVWSGNGFHHMNIYINSALLSGNDLRVGDEIAVFDGDNCVGSIQINSSGYDYLHIPVSMNDPMTANIDGFVNGNRISFRIWDSWQFIEYYEDMVNTVFLEGGSTFQSGESSVVNISVTLPNDSYFTPVWGGNGYNHMNIYVSSAVIGGESLSLNDEIAVFDRDICVGAIKLQNNLTDYFSIPVSMDDPVTPELDGYTPGNYITFKIWKADNYTEYGIDEISVTYLQGQNVFEIGGTANVRLRVFSQDETYFTPIWSGNGYQHMNFYISNVAINETDLSYGDEIAVFDGDYCVGAVKYSGGGYQYLSIITSMNDPMTPYIDGYNPGNTYSFKIWDAQNFVEYDEQDINVELLQGTTNFVIGGTVIANLSIGEIPLYQLSLNVNPANAGTISGQGLYAQGQSVNISTSANAGYQFENWTKDGLVISTEESFTFTMPANDVEIYANYSLIPVFNPPQNLLAEPDYNQILLTWAAPENPTNNLTGFKVYRDHVAITDVLNESMFVDYNVEAGIEYTYYVTAIYENPDGESEPSNEEIASTLIPVFNPPQNLTATPGYGQITLSWEAPLDIQATLLGYKIYKDNSALPQIISELSFTDTNVENNVNYDYFVIAVYQNPDGISTPSNTVTATPLIPVFNPPRNLTATENYGYIALYWEAPVHNPNTNFQGYIIYRNNTALTSTISGLSYADNYVEDNVVYEYFVVAVYSNPDGISIPSNTVTVTPLVPTFNPPQNLVVTPGYDQIILNWEAPESVTRAKNKSRGFSFYNVYRNDTVITQTTQLNFIDTNVEINVDYTYYVTAVYAGPSGESEPSNAITASLLVSEFNPPQNLTAIPGYGQITLEWEMQYIPDDYTTYKVFRDGENIAQVAELSFIDYYVEDYVDYTYYVTAVYVNPEGESDPSNIITATPLIPVFNPPYNLTATPGYGQIALEWEIQDLPNDYTTYKIYRDEEYLAQVVDLAYIDYNVEDNIDYSYYVTAVYVDPAGESDPSNIVTVSTLLPVFNPPQNLIAISGYDHITLEWDAPNIIDRRASQNRALFAYNIYKDDMYVSQVTELTYTDYYVENNIDYTYYVTAVYFDPTGESEPSNEVTASTLIPLHNPPQNLSAIPGYGQIMLEWETPDLPVRNLRSNRDLVSYKVYRDEMLLAEVPELSYTDLDVEDSVEYTYYVTAIYANPDGESEPSNEVTASTLIPIFNPPQNLIAISGYGQIMLEWEMPDLPVRNLRSNRDLVSYKIYRDEMILAELTELSYTDLDVEDNVEYTYYVTAIYANPDGESQPSNEVTVSTLIPVFNPPQNLSAIPGYGQITLEWETPDLPVRNLRSNRDLVSYKIYRDEMILAELTELSYTDLDVEDNIEYTYYVTAIYTNPAGESEPSNEVTASTLVEEFPAPINLISMLAEEWVTLLWQEPEMENGRNLIGYKIFKDNELIAESTNPFFTDFELEQGIEYLYYVTAIYANPNGESEPSNTIIVSLIDFYLAPPVNLIAEIENESIVLNWQVPVEEYDLYMLLGYRIYRDNETIDVVDIEDSTSYIDEDIELENIYTYWVSALYLYLDENGENAQMYESPYSNTVEVNYTSINDISLQLQASILKGNYPNPFNPETTINFSLKSESEILLEVFDVKGRRVATLANKSFKPGNHNIVWKAQDEHGKALSSGVYFYRLKTQNTVETKKMILIK